MANWKAEAGNVKLAEDLKIFLNRLEFARAK